LDFTSSSRASLSNALPLLPRLSMSATQSSYSGAEALTQLSRRLPDDVHRVAAIDGRRPAAWLLSQILPAAAPVRPLLSSMTSSVGRQRRSAPVHAE
jgi:hypothetical protein